jgi:hypothetical protein
MNLFEMINPVEKMQIGIYHSQNEHLKLILTINKKQNLILSGSQNEHLRINKASLQNVNPNFVR